MADYAYTFQIRQASIFASSSDSQAPRPAPTGNELGWRSAIRPSRCQQVRLRKTDNLWIFNITALFLSLEQPLLTPTGPGPGNSLRLLTDHFARHLLIAKYQKRRSTE